MPSVPLDCSAITHLGDGTTGRVVDRAITDVIKDINDRPDDRTKRSVVITLTFTPAPDGRVKIHTAAKTKVPDQRPYETIARIDDAAGGAIFKTDSCANPDQQTLEDIEPNKKSR